MSATPPLHWRALVPEQTTIHTLDLPDLLPTGRRLALSEEIGLAALVTLDAERRPVLIALEWSLLSALLGLHPAYCPYEVLLAHFHYYASVIERKNERLRGQLAEAQEEGTWDLLMRPARNILSRVRSKLRPFGIAIISLLETGYTPKPRKDALLRQAARDTERQTQR